MDRVVDLGGHRRSAAPAGAYDCTTTVAWVRSAMPGVAPSGVVGGEDRLTIRAASRRSRRWRASSSRRPAATASPPAGPGRWPAARCRRAAAWAPRPWRARRLSTSSLLERVVGDAAVELERQVDAGVGAEAELADAGPAAACRAVQEELLAEVVEERVARHGERVVHVDRAVRARPVVERARRVREHAAHAGGADVVGDRLERVGALVVVRTSSGADAGRSSSRRRR